MALSIRHKLNSQAVKEEERSWDEREKKRKRKRGQQIETNIQRKSRRGRETDRKTVRYINIERDKQNKQKNRESENQTDRQIEK